MHSNSVKHALVARARDWPYASVHRFLREGLLPIDWPNDVSVNSEAWYGERE